MDARQIRHEPILVPRAVLDGIEAIRRAGATNMLDRPRVAQLCDELGFCETALWVHDHRSEYARGVFHGFRVELHAGERQQGAPDA